MEGSKGNIFGVFKAMDVPWGALSVSNHPLGEKPFADIQQNLP